MEIPRIPFVFVAFLVLLSSPAVPKVRAQHPNYSPAIAIVTVILVGTLVLVSFFIIYVFYCSDTYDNVFHIDVHVRDMQHPRLPDVSVIQGFPTFSFQELKDDNLGRGVQECPICLGEFEDHEKLTLIPACNHIFHAQCVDAWLKLHATCPVCRANLTPSTKYDDVKIQVDDGGF